MIIYTLLLASQLAVLGHDSLYSSPALATLVETVSKANRRVPPDLTGYTAKIESELAVLVSKPGGENGTAVGATETAAQVEQLQSWGVWDRRGTFQQTVVGYRARQLAPMVSALTIVPRPWTAPTLYGDRLALIFGGPPSFRTADSTRREMTAVHPFAEDRDEYYRFSGGDTVASVHLGPQILKIVRIHVEPLEQHRAAMVFAGDVLVDGGSGAIIRMRGRIKLTAPSHEPMLARVIRRLAHVQEIAYIDFENSMYDGRFWLPDRQRLEYQATTGLTESRATVRVQSVWRDVKLGLRDADSAAAGDTLEAPHYSLQLAPPDSTAKWSDWDHELGAMTADASIRDFDDVAPPEFRPDGSAQLRWQARRLSDLLRVNRVEGLFLGASALLDLRQAAPGVSVQVFGGWATLEGAFKGGFDATRVRGPWISTLRAERQLASTNDFSQMLGRDSGNPIGSLFGQEDYDWVDRYTLALGLTRELGQMHASSVTVEVAEGRDDGFARELMHGPIAGTFRPNRPVTPGRYVSSRLQLDLGRNIVTNPLVSGVGATMAYTRGDGTLSWQRAQVQALAQRMFGRFEVSARADAAIARGSDLPIQQLLEIGGTEGLPGYGYKAFSGDQATVGRATVGYLLPIWESPMRLGRVVLPAVGPRVQVGVFGGRASATPTTSLLLDRLGWVTSDGWRGSLDFRLRFFGGAISVGASRPIDQHQGWKAAVNFGDAL